MTDLTSAPVSEKFLIHGDLVTDRGIVKAGLLVIDGDRIVYAGRADHFDEPGFASSEVPAANVIALPAGQRMLPGLVDIHNHGGNGGDFPSGDEASARVTVGVRPILGANDSGTTPTRVSWRGNSSVSCNAISTSHNPN